MDLGLKNKVILVAAASKGLGYGIADACSQEGALVSIGSRDKTEIKNSSNKLQAKTNNLVRGYELDMSNGESIKKWIRDSLNDFGRIDGIVVNAGGPEAGGFEKFNDEEWVNAFNLTLLSAIRMIREVLSEFKKQKSGSILTITSSSIKEPIENLILSNVFRAGVLSLVKSLANELGEFGIRVNNLVPGRIETDRVKSLDQIAAKKSDLSIEEQITKQIDLIPLGRYGTIEEFGAAGAYLLSEKASYLTGVSLFVDGGKVKTIF